MPRRRKIPKLALLAATLVPGFALAAALGVIATAAATWLGVSVLGYATSPISAIPLAVLFGLGMRDTVGIPASCEPGLRFCVKRVLRIGIVLLGVRLSLGNAGMTGLVALPLVVACIAAALLLVRLLSRALSLPARLGTLIAVGTGICGVTAIVATAPVIDATDDEVSYAVATIALFGTIALFAYPWLAHMLFTSSRDAGLFLGTAIHDTSQVAGAGLTYQQQFGDARVLDVAVVTKLVRNSLMVAVIPLVRALHLRERRRAEPATISMSGLADAVPLFILGFLAMATLRTIGDLGSQPFGIVDPAGWEAAIATIERLSEMALLLAMSAVGLSTSLRRLTTLGLRPLAVGMTAALCVGGISFALIKVFGSA